MATRRKGNDAPKWVAEYLTRWWANARAVTIGQRGTDVVGTTGIDWEVKTVREFRPAEFVAQARRRAGGRLPIVVYFPNGVGQANVEFALAIMPLHQLMDVLEDGGYAPRRGVAAS